MRLTATKRTPTAANFMINKREAGTGVDGNGLAEDGLRRGRLRPKPCRRDEGDHGTAGRRLTASRQHELVDPRPGGGPRIGAVFVHSSYPLSTAPVSQAVDKHRPHPAGYPQTVDNSWGRGCGRLGTTITLSPDDGPPVGGLLKVLGMTAVAAGGAVHSAGEKTGGLAVDNRWTAVENPAAGGGCGPRHEFYPWFSTAKPPVDNVSDLRGRRFSTVCTGAMKTMSYLF